MASNISQVVKTKIVKEPTQKLAQQQNAQFCITAFSSDIRLSDASTHSLFTKVSQLWINS